MRVQRGHSDQSFKTIKKYKYMACFYIRNNNIITLLEYELYTLNKSSSMHLRFLLLITFYFTRTVLKNMTND